MNKSKRNFGLDLLRCLAIVMVVVGHSAHMLNGTVLNLSFLVFIDGVEIFFVLSGFLIGGILIRLFEENNYQIRTKQLFHFWKRRWFRTLPNYYLILLVNTLAWLYFDNDVSHLSWKFIFFLQNFISYEGAFYMESWSLSIEEWFYFLFPIMTLLLLKLKPCKETFFLCILFFIVVPNVLRIMVSDPQHALQFFDDGIRKSVVLRLDSVMYGVLAAYVFFYKDKIWTKGRWYYFIIGLLIVLVTGNLSLTEYFIFSQTFKFSLLGLGVMLMLPVIYSWSQFENAVGRAVTHISIISYSMYLINLSILAVFFRKFIPIRTVTDGYLSFMAYWFILILVSSLLYWFYEKPMTNLRDRI